MFSKIILLCSFAIVMIGIYGADSSLCDEPNFFPIEKAYEGCVECCWYSFKIAANVAKVTLCSKIEQYPGSKVANSSGNILKNIHDLGNAALNITTVIGTNCTDCEAIKYVVCDFAARIRCFNSVLASCDAYNALADLQNCVVASATNAAYSIETLSQDCLNVTNTAVASGLAIIQNYYADPKLFQVDLPTVVSSNCC